METEEGKVKDVRMSLGSVAPTAVRAYETESLLKGTGSADLEKEEFCAALKEALLKDICPIDDVRATKEYRQRVAFRMLMHNLKELWKGEVA